MLVFAIAFAAALQVGFGETDTRPYCGPRPEHPEDVPFGYIPPLSQSGLKLFFTQHLIRHGDRTGFTNDCWPNDSAALNCNVNFDELPTNEDHPHFHAGRLFRKKYIEGETTFKGCPAGYLTPKGFRQHIHNGMELRKAYVDSGFLSHDLDGDEVYVRSDDDPRTIMSIEALLSGMFPTQNEKGYPEVVPLNVRESSFSDMVPASSYCPILTQQINEAETSPEYVQYKQNYTLPLQEKIQKIVGPSVKVDFQPPFFNFFDCLNVHTCHNFPVPIGEDLVKEVTDVATYEISAIYSLPNRTFAAQAGIGFLIKDFYDQAKAAVAGNSPLKFAIVSGHDTSIMPFLVAFDMFDGMWTPYSSVLSMEYYRTETGKVIVRFVYNGKVIQSGLCSPVTLDDGTSTHDFCDWEDFSKAAQSVIVADRQSFCNPL
mmetsp:Transcript_29171/g.75064  ORF Transcript_29171/g.75064 Transcript_29171/m.75064 type:complete len:428 (-) Transcript_29171:1908-3191(-)